jgi:hypothetical protein
VSAWRYAVGAVYVSVIGLFFGDYYYNQRYPEPGVVGDASALLILTGLVGFFFGLAISRWWALLLPLPSLLFAGVAALTAAFDDQYAAHADSGGEVGLEWFQLAASLMLFAVPSLALGIGLARLTSRVFRRKAARLA